MREGFLERGRVAGGGYSDGFAGALVGSVWVERWQGAELGFV